MKTILALGTGARLISAVAGLVTLHFVVANLSPILQGYYFAFSSLSQMTQLADFGLQILIVQFASHEAAFLKFGAAGQVAGPARSISRLISLGHFGLAWYGGISLILVPALLLGGHWLFSGQPTDVAWQAAWVAVSVLVTLDLCLSTFIGMLEGSNDLTFVYTYRLTRAAAVPTSTWVLLAQGFELWAIPAGLFTGVTVSILFLLVLRLRFVLLFRHRSEAGAISWRHEIIPLQWRLGLSAIAGFATYSLLVPVTFKFAGPVAAGQFGLTWALVETMTYTSLVWMAVKFPTMGALAARGEWNKLDRLSLRTGLRSVLLTLLGATAIVVFTLGLYVMSHPLAERVLPVLPVAILAVSAVVKSVQACLIYYLRAHLQEPIAVLTSVATPIMIVVVIIAAKLYGTLGIATGYFLVMSLLWLPGTLWITIRFRRTLHGKRRSFREHAGKEPLAPGEPHEPQVSLQPRA